MDMKKSKVVSIILMNMVMAEIEKIVDSEIDKGENGDYQLVDLLVETNEALSISCEQLGKDIIQ